MPLTSFHPSLRIHSLFKITVKNQTKMTNQTTVPKQKLLVLKKQG